METSNSSGIPSLYEKLKQSQVKKETPKTGPSPVPGGAPKTEAKKTEPPKGEVKKIEPPKTEAKKVEPPKTEVKKTEPPKTGGEKTESPKGEKKKPGFWSRVRGLVGRGKEKDGEPKKEPKLEAKVPPKAPEAKKPEPPKGTQKVETPIGPTTQAATPRKRKRLFMPAPRRDVPAAATKVEAAGPTGEALAARIETRVEAALSTALGKKDEALTRLQEGFRGLTDRLDRIGDGLEGQTEYSRKILDRLGELPDLLARMPEAAGREEEILQTIEREIGAQTEWGKAMVDALGDLPRLIEVVNEGGECDQAQLTVMRALSREVESQSRQRAKMIRSVEDMKAGIDKLVTELSLAREQRTQTNETLDQLGKTFSRLDHHGVEQKEIMRELARSSRAGKDAVDGMSRTVHRAVADAQERTVSAMRHLEIERERRWKEGARRVVRPVAVVGAALLLLLLGSRWIDQLEKGAEPDVTGAMIRQATRKAAEAHARADRTEEQLGRVLGALERLNATKTSDAGVGGGETGHAATAPAGGARPEAVEGESERAVPEPPFESGRTSLLFDRPMRHVLRPETPLLMQFGDGSVQQLATAEEAPARTLTDDGAQ